MFAGKSRCVGKTQRWGLTSPKIRCAGGETPHSKCARCQRLRRPCSFGGPNLHVRDESRPFGGRSPVTNLATPVSNADGTLAGSEASASIHSPRNTERVGPVARNPDPQGPWWGVPQTLLWELIEIYFSHIYNASLLLHRPSFVQALHSGTVTSHVLLSVCAFASKYDPP